MYKKYKINFKKYKYKVYNKNNFFKIYINKTN